VTGKPHSQRLVQIEVINSKQLDIFFQFGEDAPFNSDSLRCYLVGCRDALDPVEEVGDAEREGDSHPLPEVVEDRWMASEQGLLRLGLFRGRVCGQIGIAETALDRRRLNAFPTYRTRFRFVTHLLCPFLWLGLLMATASHRLLSPNIVVTGVARCFATSGAPTGYVDLQLRHEVGDPVRRLL
jgi:hypothetical protein